MLIRSAVTALSLSLAVACAPAPNDDAATESTPGTEAQAVVHESTLAEPTLRTPRISANSCTTGTCANQCICEYVACLELNAAAEFCDDQQDECFDECE